MLFDSIKNGDAVGVRAAIGADPAAGHRAHESGVSAIIYACYCKQPALAAELVAGVEPTPLEAAALGDLAHLGDDVSCRSADGFTSLHYACFFGHLDVARALLDAGADVNAVAENPSRVLPLHSATAARNAPIVALLIERGADVDAQQRGGYTALMAAKMHDDQAIIEALLAAGASE